VRSETKNTVRRFCMDESSPLSDRCGPSFNLGQEVQSV
jgi:hypothetical protein